MSVETTKCNLSLIGNKSLPLRFFVTGDNMQIETTYVIVKGKRQDIDNKKSENVPNITCTDIMNITVCIKHVQCIQTSTLTVDEILHVETKVYKTYILPFNFCFKIDDSENKICSKLDMAYIWPYDDPDVKLFDKLSFTICAQYNITEENDYDENDNLLPIPGSKHNVIYLRLQKIDT
jgi:hypothetical protein